MKPPPILLLIAGSAIAGGAITVGVLLAVANRMMLKAIGL